MKLKWLFLIGLIVTLIFVGCSKNSVPTGPDHEDENKRNLVILYTNDEHGWMESSESTGGAAGMMGLWRQNENYTSDGPFLILSGGDNWTGPAISTWFQGESMVEVMNAMNYTASAIGNHEFDFKIDGLKTRIQQADFSYLSANIREKSNGNIPEFATPYIIKEVNDIQVGIIGLTTTTAPYSTFPDNVKDYNFIPYDDALTEVIPEVLAGGAELLVVAGHLCAGELRTLATTASQLGITVIGGGHCNDRMAEVVEGVTLIESGAHMQAYAKVELTFNIETDNVVSISANTHDNTGGTPDPEVASIVAKWKAQVDAQLSEVIGYAGETIPRNSAAMHNMVTDSWLVTFPSANVSVTNGGGIRQNIPVGNITLGTMVGLLPFENTIFELELTGTQLISFANDRDIVFGGMTSVGGYSLSDGTSINPNTIYKVLTTDYLYSARSYLPTYDANPYSTSVHYRQPVIDWIRSLNTTSNNPLNNYLDTVPRQ